MNCEKFQTIANDLARNQSRDPQRAIPAGVVVMDANERADAKAHVNECDACRKTLSDQLALSERLRAVADETKSSMAPKYLEVQLLTAFRDQARVRFLQPARWRYWMSAAAAVLLLAFGLLSWRWQVSSMRQPTADASSKSATVLRPESPKQEQSPAVAVTGTRLTKSSTAGLAPKRSTSRRDSASSQPARVRDGKRAKPEQSTAVAAHRETKEVATGFVPVGYGSALDLQDGGQLVRVELPRSALTRFGLPMNMDRADERIKADVLVGSDGLARAIRFIEVKTINK